MSVIFQPFFKMGQDIEGGTPVGFAPNFGWSVSLSADGTRVAISARAQGTVNGIASGLTQVYEWDCTTSEWVQLGENIIGDNVFDVFGTSVSLSADGTRLAVGAEVFNSITGGYAKIYQLNIGSSPSTSAWIQIGQTINGEDIGDGFGISVSLSADGTIVAIGAYLNDGVNGTDSGHTRIYELNIPPFPSSPVWVQLGEDIDGESMFDQSGQSVSLSADGTIVAIGANENDGVNGTDSGHTRIYEWNIDLVTPAWVQLGEDIDGEAIFDQSGQSVSLSADGTIIAIGANRNDGVNGTDSGHTRVYKWDTNLVTPTWVQMGSDIDGEATNDQSGFSVSLSANGTRVAIGAYRNDGNGTRSGHTRIYEWNTDLVTPAWVQIGIDIDGEAAFDQSGQSVSLSTDGKRVAIGAIANKNEEDGPTLGHARVFDFNGYDISPTCQLINSGSIQLNWYGNELYDYYLYQNDEPPIVVQNITTGQQSYLFDGLTFDTQYTTYTYYIEARDKKNPANIVWSTVNDKINCVLVSKKIIKYWNAILEGFC
jgi:hypothetical protein